MTDTTVNPDEIAKFARMADAWWDPEGDFRPLHSPNRLRSVPSPLLLVISAGMFLLSAGCALGADPHQPAISIVQRVGIDDNLRALLAAYVPATTSGQMVAQECGTDHARQMTEVGIDAAWAAKGSQWEEANAKLIEQLVDPAVIASSETASPEDLKKVLGSVDQARLSAGYKETLEPIVKDALSMVLQSILEAAPKQCAASK